MDVRVIREFASPGVQHPEETRHLPAQVARIGRELLDRPGRGLEQGGVTAALMAAQERAQRLGHGEGEHEVMPGQLAGKLALQPRLGLVMLTARAMPIAAAAGNHMRLGASLALIERAAGLGAATPADRPDHLLMMAGDRIEVLDIGRAVRGEQLLESAHVRDPP